jgi:hypothetical protein
VAPCLLLILQQKPFIQKPPDILFLEQPFNWLQIAVSIFQILFLGFLTIYTFRSGARQKLAERRAAWYHKLVVDPMITKISEFFEKAEVTLCGAAELAESHRAEAKKGIGTDAKKKIATFKKSLYEISRDLQYRLSPFGSDHEKKVSDLMDALEDDVTAWFDFQAKAAAHEQREDLSKLLKRAEVSLFRSLIDIEFETWGWPLKRIRLRIR